MNGPSAADRLDRDVFGVAGLRYVVWLEGINDLDACLASGDQVIEGFKEVVARLHSKKVKVIGATIVSSFGSPIGSYGFPKIDDERKNINDFIRTSGSQVDAALLALADALGFWKLGVLTRMKRSDGQEFKKYFDF